MKPQHRIIYLGGIRGTGKTMFCLNLGASAEVGFIPQPPNNADFPWPTNVVIEGQPVWPGEWTHTGTKRVHNFSHRDEYRKLLEIPTSAAIVRVSGDGFNFARQGMDHASALLLLRKVQDFLLKRYDFIVHDMLPQAAPEPNEHAVMLAAPAGIIEERSKTSCWGGRAPFDHDLFVEEARKVWQQQQKRLWSGGYKYDAFWWTGDHWVPMQEWIRAEIDRLSPWYQYFELGSIPVGHTSSLNGEGRWKALRAHMPASLLNKQVLDIGCNAGYNSLQAALEGAKVTAIEASPHYLEQWNIIKATGIYPVEVTNRINMIHKPAQQVDLSQNHYDIAIMSAVHYHIARSTIPSYRPQGAHYDSSTPLLPSLAVVLEDLLESTDLLVMLTNTDHYQREKDPHPEADPEWMLNALHNISWRDCKKHPGYNRSAIITAKGRGNWLAMKTGPKFPITPDKLTLMLGWRCNASCIQCWQAAARKAGTLAKVQLSLNDITDLLMRYSPRDLEICSFGEPMCHPEFRQILDALLKRHEQKPWRVVNMITNGSRLHEFLEIGDLPGMLTVSYDATGTEMYQSIRAGLNHYQVTSNLHAIAQRKNHPKREIGINMTVFERNVLNIYTMASVATGMGIDYFAVLRGENMGMTPAAAEELSANDPRVAKQIEQIQKNFPDLELYNYFQ